MFDINTPNIEKNMEQRMVFRANIARALLKKGYVIKDIRPERKQDGNINYDKVIFIFHYKEGIDEDLSELIAFQKTKNNNR